ncbi:type II toxin-antitoxin system antitoxin SocA domain-containing protein [Chloroflexota bacterium]
MVKKSPLYDETKATQVAGFLLEQGGGRMDFLKFTKIVYNIEREALKRWSHPVTHSSMCSMQAGQVLSEVHDNTKQHISAPIWKEYIDTNRKTNTISLKKETPIGKLCKAEINLIEEIYQRDKDKTILQLMNEHHKYPEYVDPGKSSIKTDCSKLLRMLGKSEEEIREFESDICESARVKELVG